MRGERQLLRARRELPARRDVYVGDLVQSGRVHAREHVELFIRAAVPELREPGPVLGDEVEREAVRAGRHRRAHVQAHRDALAGRDGLRKRGADPVPDDRVAERVEPVVRAGNVVAPR